MKTLTVQTSRGPVRFHSVGAPIVAIETPAAKKARAAAVHQICLEKRDARAREIYGKSYSELPDDGPQQDHVMHLLLNEYA